MTKQFKPGELLLVGKQTYKATTPLKQGDCLGCDLKHHNGEHNECHSPEGAGCDNCIFKKYTPTNDIDKAYEMDDIDFKGCRTGIIILSSAIGALMAALATAIYYSIII